MEATIFWCSICKIDHSGECKIKSEDCSSFNRIDFKITEDLTASHGVGVRWNQLYTILRSSKIEVWDVETKSYKTLEFDVAWQKGSAVNSTNPEHVMLICKTKN